MSTLLSGIQPSGLQHLGNYFGAIKRHVASQNDGNEHFYFIADFHALTTSRDPKQLREWVTELAVTYLALGLDPDKVTFWRQSDVPEVCELAWMLSSVCGMGLLERAHSFKDKVAHGVKPNVALFTYPLLMAADILAFDPDLVPVGKDQIQHVEMTQDMAGYFNNTYSPVFKRPECLIPEDAAHASVRGLDGQKMSKTYGNHIWIFEEGKALKKRIGAIATDSRPPEEPKNPDELVLFDLLALFLDADELSDWRERVQKGGDGAPGYGHLKQRLIAAIEEYFLEARARRKELLGDRTELERLLQVGAEKARLRARTVRDRALAACGLR